MTRGLPFLIGAGLVLQGCSDSTDPGIACPDLLRAAVLVTVLDSASNESIANGATGLAVDGDYHDTFSIPDEPRFANQRIPLAHGRTGTYDVFVLKSGYETWALRRIRVKDTVCGSELVPVTARLRKQ